MKDIFNDSGVEKKPKLAAAATINKYSMNTSDG